jgi:hypothetical protein
VYNWISNASFTQSLNRLSAGSLTDYQKIFAVCVNENVNAAVNFDSCKTDCR